MYMNVGTCMYVGMCVYVTIHEKTPLSGEKFELYFFAEWG